MLPLSSGGIARQASTQPSQQRIEKAARDLEAQFAQLLLKTMRGAGGDDPLGGNTQYRDMYDQQLARELSKGRGLGLAPVIMRQLQQQTGAGASTQAGASSLPLQTPAGTRPLPVQPTAPATLALAPSSAGVSMQAIPVGIAAPAPVPAPSVTTAAAAIPGASVFACEAAGSADCSSPEAFVKSIWPAAQQTARELGVSPRALVAQAALETNWGRSMIGGNAGGNSNNLFGIKAGGSWSGDVVRTGTHEYVDGQKTQQRAAFRAYDSVIDSFRDYGRLLSGQRYSAAREAGTDVSAFAHALQRAGYATDPAYAAKINAIANGDTLQRALASLTSSLGIK